MIRGPRSPFRHLIGACLAAGIVTAAAVVDLPGVRAQTAQPEAAGPALPAGSLDPALFSGLQWRSLGPARGGRSQAVAGSAARPLEYYFGATGGGLWKTTDGGTTWHPVSDGHFKSSSVGAIAVAPSNPDVIYVGMGETELRGNILQGDGAYKSIDGGKTWTHVGLEKTLAISRIRIDPANPEVVFVAALGDPYGPNPERGVFKSVDGGKTWRRTLFRDEKTGAVDLDMDPQNPAVLYAALWEVFRTPHSLSSGGPGSGLFKSTDGGETWRELTRNPGLPAAVWGKVGVAVSGADAARVYAIIEAAQGGVFLSDDGGESWTMVNDDRRLRQRAFYYTRIYADPVARDTVYILNTAFYKSTDAGRSIRSIRVPHGDNHDLWLAPGDPARMINANDGGANVSVNGGETWTDQDYPTAQFYNVFTTAHVPYHVCGAQQDNTTACLPLRGGTLYDVGGGESGYIAPDPENEDIFYAGSYGGLLTRVDVRTGERRAINVWPDNPMGFSSGDIAERFQWTYPIVIAPTDPDTLYVASQHVWRSTNEGQSWTRISPDLTRHDPSTLGPSGGPITLDQTGVETYATVFTLAPSPLDGKVIWAGSDDGLVHVTRDGGATWQNVTPAGLPPFTRISLIEASPHQPGAAYLAGNRYQRRDRKPYVYRTADYGRTWTAIAGGLGEENVARTIREDPVRRGLLFLGTDTGIYVSFDAGGVWQSISLALPSTPVHGIAVKNDDVVIGTHGRSFYALENIGVLRQISSTTTSQPVVLFDPGDVVRSIDTGVVIDYYLQTAAEQVTVQILDSRGAVIDTFDGRASDASGQAAAREGGGAEAVNEEDEEDEEAGGGAGRSARVSAKPGMNRFTWNMRYPGARGFPGLIMWAGSTRGPAAPPGTYTVRLRVAGITQTQEFVISRNLAVAGVTDADLREQFALAGRINARVGEANEAVLRIRHVKNQIDDRLARTADAALAAAARALSDRLTDIEGEIYQYRNRSSQDPLNFPIRLNNKLAALQGIVESGDHKPTAQAYAVFEELAGRLDRELARLEATLKSGLTPLNEQLAARRLAAIDSAVPPPGSSPPREP